MLRKLKPFLLVLVGLLVATATVGGFCLALTMPIPDRIDLKEGDLVFQTNFDTQAIAVMLASKNPYTHMGFIRHRNTGLMVVEAVGPVTETPINEWISRGAGRRLAVKRVKGLNNAALQKVFARAKQDYGKPYDFYFLPDGKAIYCSELVKASFAAAGISLGKLQKVAELASSSAMESIIRDRWQNYPLCHGVKGMTLEKCRGIIMKQVLVTPASIAKDPQVTPVYSNYPLD